MKTVVCDQSFAGRFVDKSGNMANSKADQVMETKRREGPPQIACKAGQVTKTKRIEMAMFVTKSFCASAAAAICS